MREKTQGNDLKNHKAEIFFGIKALKNSSSFEAFKTTWIAFTLSI